ncbi:hypothetical protein F4Z99_18460 [Candidatus Poribacteria bacterium]|nr:hypothetical protein [Candidatus Poribacteria bacterium]MYB02587.1 hypothetical protein [Candidatus Poribacteria bacterium]
MAANDSFILRVLAITQLGTLEVEDGYEYQTASALGSYESHLLYRVGNPPATEAFSAEWSASDADARTPITHFEPAAPVQDVEADALNPLVVSGLLPQETNATWACTVVMNQPDG